MCLARRRLWVVWLDLAFLALGGGAAAHGEPWPPEPRLPRPAFDAAVAARSAPQFPSIQASPIAAGRWQCSFTYAAPESAESVGLVGTFNEWSRTACPFTCDADGRTWRASVELPDGRYLYKFVVDGRIWKADPLNPAAEDDGHDGLNSVLTLGRLAGLTASPARTGDGAIDLDGVLHDAGALMYLQILDRSRALLRLRTFAHDIEAAEIVAAGGRREPMHLVHHTPLWSYYEGILDLSDSPKDGSEGRRLPYAFVLRDGDVHGVAADFPEGRFTPDDGLFRTPEWARDAIWYQIMLDRFRNGDPANDPQPVHPWTSEWFKLQPWESRNGETFYKFAVFQRLYGGDLKGLIEKLPYLRDLGVNAIYLNPVFEAESHHKYNATNFVHIDDDFGTRGDYAAAIEKEELNDPKTWGWTETDQLFLKAISECHKVGIRVVIDGVFNHVGTRHPAFVDVKKKGKASKYADWFDVTSWEPFEYTGWAGHDALPVFRKSPNGLACPQTTRHIFNVTRRWMDPDGDGDPRDGIDGWRLDVPNEIAPPFWVEWRRLVKSINPDAYITGEIWDRADAWLDGRTFDAVMNYQFAEPLIRWVTCDKLKVKASELDARLAELRLAYPRAATYVMQNLVDSHDTDRLVSMALNPDRAYDRENRVQDNGPRYNNAKPGPRPYRQARLIALAQMTYVGAPMVYYGDEAGMWGADDPTCRKPMLWSDLQPYESPDENHVLLDHLDCYRQLIALRNAHPALRRGEFQALLTDDAQDVWVFGRYDDREKLIIALNASDEVRRVNVPIPGDWPRDWTGRFGEENDLEAQASAGANASATLPIRIPAIGGIVLQAGP